MVQDPTLVSRTPLPCPSGLIYTSTTGRRPDLIYCPALLSFRPSHAKNLIVMIGPSKESTTKSPARLQTVKSVLSSTKVFIRIRANRTTSSFTFWKPVLTTLPFNSEFSYLSLPAFTNVIILLAAYSDETNHPEQSQHI